MLLCITCHSKSSCRAEVHLTIEVGVCRGCGHSASCFDCTTVQREKGQGQIATLIAMYRHTKQLTYPKSSN